ncbi:MAG: hypothetical protein ICV57_07295 [Rubrobacter sp.]|nr:hypothetical protein [Rubrobacter sp.]
MRRGRDTDRGRPAQPGEYRAHGDDSDAVEVRRTGDREEQLRAEGLGPDIPAGRPEPTSDRRRYEEVGVSSGGTAESGARRLGGHDDEGLTPARRDSIRWGPVWAGLITALTSFLLLQLLAIGLGLVGIGPGAGGGGGWVSAIIGLIAFFIGGSVAGMTSAVRSAATGLLNGFLVWALGTVLILLLSALGLGQIFGALGNVVGQLGVLQNLQSANVPDVDPARIAQAVRSGAIGAFFGLLLSALASMLGGFLGGRSSDPLGRMARE